MPNFLEVFKSIFEKIANFFDIFDLSFFVAGVICLGALATEVHLVEKTKFTELKTRYDEARQKAQTDLAAAEKKRDELVSDVARARKNADSATQEWKAALESRAAAKSGEEESKQFILTNTEDELASARTRLHELEDRLIDAKGEVAKVKTIVDHPKEEPKSMVGRYLVGANLFLVIIGVYVLGLICFAVGRFVRYGVRLLMYGLVLLTRQMTGKETLAAPFGINEILKHAVLVHGFEEDPYTNSDGNLNALYNLLWARLRESKQQESYVLIKRYWVLAATYDGVAMVLLLWALLLVGWVQGWAGVEPLQGKWGTWVSLSMVAVSLACFREAQIFLKNQIYELVATCKSGLVKKD